MKCTECHQELQPQQAFAPSPPQVIAAGSQTAGQDTLDRFRMFLYSFAHDIQNTLTQTDAFLFLLRRGLEPGTTAYKEAGALFDQLVPLKELVSGFRRFGYGMALGAPPAPVTAFLNEREPPRLHEAFARALADQVKPAIAAIDESLDALQRTLAPGTR